MFYRNSLSVLFAFGLAFSPAFSQCTFWNEVPIDLGNDTVLCAGNTLLLDGSNGYNYDFYSWSTGHTTPTITTDTAGTYIIQAGMVGGNLVVNGDFESGNTGFSSGYVQGTGGTWGTLSLEGTYDISTSPSLSHNNFTPCGDQTTGSGNMMVVNGAGSPVNVWCQTVNVQPNTNYVFSTWATNALNDPNVAQLQFSINNVSLGNAFSVTPYGCDWVQFNAIWNSGSNTTADICILNLNTTTSGNDFAIDEIYFEEVCTVSDTMEVIVEDVSVEAGPDLTFCPNEPESTTATSNINGVDFAWSSGEQTATINPNTTGWYTVEVTTSNGCTAQDSLYVDVIEMNWSIDSILMGQTSCGATNGYVSALTAGTFNDPPTYTWSGPGANSPNQINASVFQNLSPGWYYLSIESDGCYLYDSMEVTVSNPPIADLTATPSSGEAPLPVTFTNNSQNASAYSWDFGNGQGTNVNNLNPQNTVYDIAGVYTVILIASEGACADTAYATIIVTDPPAHLPFSIDIPNVFSPNNDNINEMFLFHTENVETFSVSIVNRWGNLMYSSDDPQFEWDGKVHGVEASEGTYFYTYTATDLEGNEYKGHGFFELVR